LIFAVHVEENILKFSKERSSEEWIAGGIERWALRGSGRGRKRRWMLDGFLNARMEIGGSEDDGGA
jgi:hypothetical protein